jgi:hypothetical protein
MMKMIQHQAILPGHDSVLTTHPLPVKRRTDPFTQLPGHDSVLATCPVPVKRRIPYWPLYVKMLFCSYFL